MNKINAKFSHINLIANDWRALADFYIKIFGCTPVPPERDFQGEKLEAGTGLKGAHITGIHLRLPGHGENGPTLEIFTYNRLEARPPIAVNRSGYGHIAFSVDNVNSARQTVLQSGGGSVGDVVTLQIAGGDLVTWCYVTDPEGNIIELQSWSKNGKSD